MMLKIVIGFVVILAAFLGFVAAKNGKFEYQRSDLINAPPEKIFPYLSSFKMGGSWSPYEKIDPQMKKTYAGVDGQVGSSMEFDGNNQAGAGRLDMLKIVPNESVEIRLTMTRPVHGENLVQYRLTPEGNATRFTWTMSGEAPFVMKLVGIFINCEKMVTDQFAVGIGNLKVLIEGQK